MSKGRKLERISRIIQEAFKSIPETKIYSNYKITNISGREREIDILIESTINGYEIRIAIECKNYGRKVSVEKIEAFYGKCQRIRGLHKMVIISSNGFQKDALNAAKDFDIDIYELKDISSEVVLSWIDTTQIKQLFTTLRLGTSNISVVGEGEEHKNLPDLSDNILAYFNSEKEEPIPLLKILVDNINKNKRSIHSYVLSGFFLDKEKKLPRIERIPTEVELKGVFILGKNNKKYPVSKIKSVVIATLNSKNSNITDIRRYENYKNKNNKAEIVSIETGHDGKLDLVNKTENGEISFFYTDKDGLIKKLKTLASYDPNKDEWEIENK